MCSRYPRAVEQASSAARVALGAACAIFDDHARVLLVHHTYGRLNWEIPGGGGEPGEAPDETALRELLEETGLRGEIDRLTGVYLEPETDRGPLLHFVFTVRILVGADPVPSSPEISEARFWPVDDLPTPISDFTERRIRDAFGQAQAGVVTIGPRQWRT